MTVTRVIGNPGTGKTTHLVRLFSDLVNSGICADQICYVAFTRKATHEAKARVSSATGVSQDGLTWIRTLHSLAYFTQGIDGGQLLSEKELDNIMLGAGINDPQEKTSILNAHSYHLLTGESIEKCWARFQGARPSSRLSLERYAQIYQKYKGILGKMDYHDLLKRAVNNPIIPTFHTVIVDEAQDLSPIQWQLVGLLASKAQNLVLAGDPHQAIYQWCGADASIFKEYPVDEEIILPQSYRIPLDIQRLSLAVLSRFSDPSRYPYQPAGHDGGVQHTIKSHLPMLGLRLEDSYLVLSRNELFLKESQDYLYRKGKPYHTLGTKDDKDKLLRRIEWYNEAVVKKDISENRKNELEVLCSDLRGCILKSIPWYEALDAIPRIKRDYYYNLLSTEAPNISIGTIHASKGGEADHVIILGDFTQSVKHSFIQNPDLEYATLYVGCTRAKKTLTLVEGTRYTSYNWRSFL